MRDLCLLPSHSAGGSGSSGSPHCPPLSPISAHPLRVGTDLRSPLRPQPHKQEMEPPRSPPIPRPLLPPGCPPPGMSPVAHRGAELTAAFPLQGYWYTADLLMPNLPPIPPTMDSPHFTPVAKFHHYLLEIGQTWLQKWGQ